MTHDELTIRIIKLSEDNNENWKFYPALRKVVELHRNVDGACWECQDSIYHKYPCPTIRAIEKELK